MDWKEWSKNTAKRAGSKIKENTVDAVSDQFHADLDNNKAVQAYRGTKSALSDMKGLSAKDRAKYLIGKAGNKVGGKIKNSDLYKRAKEFVDTIKKIVTFIIDNLKVIAIVGAIVAVGSVVVTFIVSLSQAFGPTPHFYCEFTADEFVQDLAFYQQYCNKNADSFDLESINGHYIVYDLQTSNNYPDSHVVELEKACSIENMLLRFAWMNGIPYYDCLWGSDGQYPLVPAFQLTYENGGNNPRNWIIGGEYYADSNYSFENGRRSPSVMGARNFAAAVGAGDNDNPWTAATWGYCRDSSTIFDNTANAYSSQGQNQNWVWDLSAPMDCTWYVDDDNLDIDIFVNSTNESAAKFGEIHINFVSVYDDEGMWEDLTDLVDLLQGNRGYRKHPEGIVVVTANDAILLSGFDPAQGGFVCIDSARGMAGGFEGPVSSRNFNSSSITQEMLADPVGSGILGYYEIVPTFENQGDLGNYMFGSGYQGMLSSRRPVLYNAPNSNYADAIVEYALAVANDRDAAGNIVGYLWVGNNGHYEDNFRHQGDQGGKWNNIKDHPEPYVLDNYDCSGLAICCLLYASQGTYSGGNVIPANGGSIYWPHGTNSMYGYCGTAVALENIQPGDFILTSSDLGYTSHHILIYVGDVNNDGTPDCVEAMGWSYGCGILRNGLPSGICEVIRIYPPGLEPAVIEEG